VNETIELFFDTSKPSVPKLVTAHLNHRKIETYLAEAMRHPMRDGRRTKWSSGTANPKLCLRDYRAMTTQKNAGEELMKSWLDGFTVWFARE
jgi:hypothetical protein